MRVLDSESGIAHESSYSECREPKTVITTNDHDHDDDDARGSSWARVVGMQHKVRCEMHHRLVMHALPESPRARPERTNAVGRTMGPEAVHPVFSRSRVLGAIDMFYID